jgi:hypothetical protein
MSQRLVHRNGGNPAMAFVDQFEVADGELVVRDSAVLGFEALSDLVEEGGGTNVDLSARSVDGSDQLVDGVVEGRVGTTSVSHVSAVPVPCSQGPGGVVRRLSNTSLYLNLGHSNRIRIEYLRT